MHKVNKREASTFILTVARSLFCRQSIGKELLDHTVNRSLLELEQITRKIRQESHDKKLRLQNKLKKSEHDYLNFYEKKIPLHI